MINGRPSVAWAATCCLMCAPRQCPQRARRCAQEAAGIWCLDSCLDSQQCLVSQSVSRLEKLLILARASMQIPAIWRHETWWSASIQRRRMLPLCLGLKTVLAGRPLTAFFALFYTSRHYFRREPDLAIWRLIQRNSELIRQSDSNQI